MDKLLNTRAASLTVPRVLGAEAHMGSSETELDMHKANSIFKILFILCLMILKAGSGRAR